MLLLEQVGVEEQFPSLLSRLDRRQWIPSELVPVFLQGGESDCAGRRNADLDHFRPFFILEDLRLLFNDTSH